MMLIYMHDGGSGTPGYYYSKADVGSNNVHAQGSLSLTTVNNDTFSVTAVYDTANTVTHMAAVDSSGSLQYLEYSGGSWSPKNLIATAAETPSMGLSSGIGIPQLYVVYQQAGGLNIDYANVSITNANNLGGWEITAPWELVSNGSVASPHITNLNTLPVPPRVIWSDNTPIVYFGTLYVNQAPSLISVYPSSAPYTNNPFDVTITGANFGASNVDYGGETKAAVLWKGGASQGAFTAITASSSTYINGTTLKVTMQVSNNVGNFDLNQATSTPTFQFQVTNPDGQQTAVSTNTLSIPVPAVSTATAVSVTTNSLGLQALSDIILKGVNFEGWNTLLSTGRPNISVGSSGVTVTSITFVTPLQARASVVITTNATAGYQTISLTNPDGQSSNVLTSSFTITIPTTTIDLPATGISYVSPAANYVQNLSTFTGGAGAYWGGAPSGGAISSVEILIQQGSGNFWGGSGFSQPTRTLAWQLTSGTTQWTYSPVSTFGTLANRSSYTIWARGHTSDLGLGVDGSSMTVIVDNKDPFSEGGTVAITLPVQSTTTSDLSTIQGLVEDPTSGVQAGSVTVRIIDLGPIFAGVLTGAGGYPHYWNGSSFDSNTTDFVQLTPGEQIADPPGSNLPTSWTYPMSGTSLSDGHAYQVQARATDAVGNVSAWLPSGTGLSGYYFVYDISAPTSTVTSPATDLTTNTTNTYVTAPLSSISGTTSDNTSNLAKVLIEVHDLSGSWLLPSATGFASFNPGPSTTTVGANSWQLNTSTSVWQDGHLYEIYTEAVDDAGNAEGNGTFTLKSRFRYDTQLPHSSLINPPFNNFNNTPLAYENVTVITGTSTDVTDLGFKDSGISQVQISLYDTGNGVYFDPISRTFHLSNPAWDNCTNTVVYQSSVAWASADYTGKFQNATTYNVQVRAIDRAGNVEIPAVASTFMYSVSSPTIVTSAPVSGAYNQQVVSYNGQVNTVPSGIAEMPIRIVRASDGAIWNGNTSHWGSIPAPANRLSPFLCS